MVITRLISGLGNQLFQYAIGRLISIKHGVPLKLDTTFFETQALRSFKLDHFNIKAEVASKEEIDRFLFWQNNPALVAKVFRKTQAMLPRRSRRYFKELELWTYDPDVLNVSSRVYLEGYWQHHKYYESVHPDLLSELTLKSISQNALIVEKSIQENQCSISLHIRRGDYVTDANTSDVFGTLPTEYYSKATSLLSSKFPGAHYYIFSDDLNWAKDNLRLKYPATFVELGEGSNTDFLELNLMSKCCHNIIANSSFSWWGAFLNRNPEKMVIAPSNWVVRPDLNSRIQLQFPSWIKF